MEHKTLSQEAFKRLVGFYALVLREGFNPEIYAARMVAITDLDVSAVTFGVKSNHSRSGREKESITFKSDRDFSCGL